MAMTQSEINALINKINAGTYTLDDALADIAAAAKGRDVRKAIYALAYLTGGSSGISTSGAEATAEAKSNHTNITCTYDINIASTASVAEVV